MSAPTAPLVVLGIGNVLRGDDGVGVHVIRALEARLAGGGLDLPPVEVVEGGTTGLALLPRIHDARALLLVDALDLGAVPGTVLVLRGPEIPGMASGTEAFRRGGLEDLLASARLAAALPTAVGLIGIQPLSIAAGLDLSPPVRAAVPRAVDAAIAEIRRLDRAAGSPGTTARPGPLCTAGRRVAHRGPFGPPGAGRSAGPTRDHRPA